MRGAGRRREFGWMGSVMEGWMWLWVVMAWLGHNLHTVDEEGAGVFVYDCLFGEGVFGSETGMVMWFARGWSRLGSA